MGKNKKKTTSSINGIPLSSIVDDGGESDDDGKANKNKNKVELDTGEFRMTATSRRSLEIMMILSTLVTLFGGTALSVHYSMAMQTYYEPFPLIFSDQVPRMQRDNDKNDKFYLNEMKSYNETKSVHQVSAWYALAGCNALYDTFKLWALQGVIESEMEMVPGGLKTIRLSMLTITSTVMLYVNIGLSVFISHTCFTSINKFESAFKRAQFYYPILYKERIELDQLQIHFKCCGSTGYKDYFKVPVYGNTNDPVGLIWQKFIDFNNTQFLTINPYKHLYGYENHKYLLTHDVPWSCCDDNKLELCRLYNVDNSVGLYQNSSRDQQETLNTYHTAGCVDKIRYELETLAVKLEIISTIRVVIEIVAGIMLRIVLYSYTSEYELKQVPSITFRPTGIAAIYIISLGVFLFQGIYFWGLPKHIIATLPSILPNWLDFSNSSLSKTDHDSKFFSGLNKE